jgi:hypothetical protein
VPVPCMIIIIISSSSMLPIKPSPSIVLLYISLQLCSLVGSNRVHGRPAAVHRMCMCRPTAPLQACLRLGRCSFAT